MRIQKDKEAEREEMGGNTSEPNYEKNNNYVSFP